MGPPRAGPGGPPSHVPAQELNSTRDGERDRELPDFRLGLLAKFLCFAIVAVGIDLAWGYGGMLTLGQGVFFGLGAYSMGMFLKLHEAGPGNVPDFMS